MNKIKWYKKKISYFSEKNTISLQMANFEWNIDLPRHYNLWIILLKFFWSKYFFFHSRDLIVFQFLEKKNILATNFVAPTTNKIDSDEYYILIHFDIMRNKAIKSFREIRFGFLFRKQFIDWLNNSIIVVKKVFSILQNCMRKIILQHNGDK